MKKSLSSLVIVILLIACGEKTETTKENEKPIVKIGAILPLSGNGSDLGKASQIGMKLAIEDRKEELHYDYQLIFEDSLNKPKNVAMSANKLLNMDNVDVITTFIIGNGIIVAPLADKNNTLHLCASLGNKYSAPIGNNTFIQGTANEDLQMKVVNFFKKKNINKVAIISTLTPVSEMLVKNLSLLMKNEGIENIENFFNPGETDFKMLIQKLKYKGFKNFYIIAFPPETDLLIKQMHDMEIDNSQIFGQGIDIGTNNALYEGINCFGMNLGNQEFIDRIINKHNLSNFYGTSTNYDLINLIIDAYEDNYKKQIKPTTENLITYINNRKTYDCISGGCKVLDNRFIVNPPSHRVYKNGFPIVIEEEPLDIDIEALKE